MSTPTQTTTNTNSFNLDLNNVVEEAFERCGAELRSGYDMRTASRSLSLMFAEWANRGINLWTLATGTIPLVAGTATYTLPVTAVDLLDHVVSTNYGTSNQEDINITRISSSTYWMIPNKNATGRPIQVWINRQSGNTNANSTVASPTITIWPVPETGSSYTFSYTYLRRMYDPGVGYNIQDIPFRFLNAMTAGLAYFLSLKIPGAETRTQMLKQIYDESFQLAADEDREKAAVRFVPRETFIGYR